MDTLRELAGKLSADERAEYEAMAQGILDDEERLAIVGYLLKTHFEAEAARGVLDEGGGAENEAVEAAPSAPARHDPAGGGPAGGGPPGGGRRRRRRRRRGGAGGHGPSGGHMPGAA